MNAGWWKVPARLAALLGIAEAARAADEVVVPGQPALTRRALDQAREGVEWALGREMSASARALYERQHIAGWKEMDAEARAAHLKGVEHWAQSARLAPL